MDFGSYSLNDMNHKNNIIFKNIKAYIEDLFSMTQIYVWVWMIHRIPRTTFSLLRLVQCLKVCLKSM